MKAFRVLIVLICLAVSAVFGVLYVSRYVVRPATQRSTASLTQVQTNTQPSPTPAPTPVYSTLPRLPTDVADFTCNATGTTGDEALLDYFRLGDYVFVLLDVDTDGMDYRATSPSLAIARFDTDCTLRDTLTLPDSGGYAYLCAAPCDSGLMVAAVKDDLLCVWVVSVNLVARYRTYSYTVTAGRMLYAQQGNVLCMTGDKLYALCLSPSLQVTWSYAVTIGAMHLVDVYQTARTYTVVTSSATEGAVYSLSSSGFLSRSAIETADYITPYARGYAVLSLARARLSLYDLSFGLEQSISLPADVYVALLSYANGLLLLSRGVSPLGRILCNHGDVQSTFDLPDGTLLDAQWADDGRLLVAMQQDTALSVYAYRLYGTAPALLATVQGANHARIWVHGGYLYGVCDSVFDYGCFSCGLGGRDVYLLRTFDAL